MRIRFATWIGVLIASGAVVADEVEAPSRQDLAQLQLQAQQWGSGVALVGDPSRGQGTAFLISREHRLLATAAHVADLFRGPGTIWAVFQGTWEPRRVERVWYHPSIRRRIADDLLVRSPDPRDGPVNVPGPDVAVLQLAEGGSPLPRAWEMAGLKSLRNLEGRSIALLGYPGYGDWPAQGQSAPISMKAGVVHRVDTFEFDEGAHPDRAQMIEHSAAAAEGSSGSPVFLDNGKVVGVHNILRLDGPQGYARAGMSVRVDSVWELLVFHKLDSLVTMPEGRMSLIVPTTSPIDPRRDALRRAVALVRESAVDAAAHQYQTAGNKCNEAIRLAPDFASAYLQRSRNFTGYCGTYWKSLDAESKRKQADWAIADAMTGFHLAPERADGLCLLLQNSLYLGHLDADKSIFREAVAGTDALLSKPYLDARERSYLTNLRAQSRHYLGQYDEALQDYNESIRLSPREPTWYVNRAQYWDQRGRPDLGAADRDVAASLR